MGSRWASCAQVVEISLRPSGSSGLRQYDRRVLYGREAERAALSALLDGVHASQSGVLVLRGEPGVGKSALLADTVDRAAGMRVLRAVGVESEGELAFAGLHQLVWPLLGTVDAIPPPQAAALRGALGLESSSGDDRFLIGAAVLSLLAAAAEEMPLLCIVDDAHWLDDPSADALVFAARRLHAEPIAVLLAAREGQLRGLDAAGLPELRIEGLAPEAARRLLAARPAMAVAPEVLERVVESSGGNPLALLELPLALSDDQRAGREPLGERLPLTGTVQAVFLRRVRELPAASQTLLLLVAADDTGDLPIVLRAMEALGIGRDELEGVEAAGLVHVGDSGIEFRHPLVRSAVYQGASFAERQRVHRVIADGLDDDRHADRRTWHLAAATLGADDELADELERSAERSRRRSGYAAAAAALQRSATLTTDDEQRARRLLAAARAAWLGGRAEPASALLDSARRLASERPTRADIDHLRALMELQRGSPAHAHEILRAAATELGAIDRHRTAELLIAAGEAAHFAGDLHAEIEAGRRAERLRAELGADRFELTMMAGIANLLDRDAARGAALLREAISQTQASENPRRFSGAGSAAFYLGDIASAVTYWSRWVDEARGQGAIATLAVALQYLALGEAIEGRVASAEVSASEGLRLAQETGQPNCAALHAATLAWAAARSGDEDKCRAHAAEAFDVAAAHGLGIQAGFATLALGELELGLGRHAESLTHLEAVWVGGRGASSIGAKLIGVPSLVEAAARAGHPDRARAALAVYEDWAVGTASPFELPVLSRCRALLATGADASGHFEEALRLHAEADQPFERARTELLYGGFLRRGRRRKEAREHLRVALDLFEQLRAEPWAESARTELRASGETARRRDPSTIDDLTPQELQIAGFVAGGASNKEVAAQLFLSPRTIDAHLRNVFAKLGITSRRQLARLELDGQRASAPPAPAPV
jgi:DNA-binding CsgD family transcriptional regulator